MTITERMIENRIEHGPVFYDGRIIAVYGYSYQLIVDCYSCIKNMGLNDFSKMLRVCGSVLDPDDYYHYLRNWYTFIDGIVKECKNTPNEQVRYAKMIIRIQKCLDKLPLWAMEESNV